LRSFIKTESDFLLFLVYASTADCENSVLMDSL